MIWGMEGPRRVVICSGGNRVMHINVNWMSQCLFMVSSAHPINQVLIRLTKRCGFVVGDAGGVFDGSSFIAPMLHDQ
jgi:hypothetical protein